MCVFVRVCVCMYIYVYGYDMMYVCMCHTTLTQVMVATPRTFQLDGEDKKSKGDEEEASWQRHRNWKLHKSEDYSDRDMIGPAYAASAWELRLSTQGTGRLQSCVRREIDPVKPEPIYCAWIAGLKTSGPTAGLKKKSREERMTRD